MDLVGIFHVVEIPSSCKHDFNHVYIVGLIKSIMIQFIFDLVHFGILSLSLVFIQCSCFGRVNVP